MTATSPGTRRELLIGELVRSNAAATPDRVAVSLDAATLSYQELDHASDRVAHALRARGLRHGERVVGWADTALDVFPLFVALAKLGAPYAPVNARLGAEETAPVAALARPSLVVADDARAEPGAKIASELGAGFLRLDELSADRGDGAPAPIDEPALREHEPHVVFFTSGSTGRPKGVVLSHRANFLRSFQGVFRDVPEISVCMFPLFHMAAFTLALSAWQTRGEIVLVPNPTAENLLAAVERRRGNRLYGIPAVWNRILAADRSGYDTSSLRELDTGTSAVPVELIEALKAAFPATTTRIYYGSTEVGSAASLADVDVLRKPGSVGFAPPGVELRVDDEGEILVRSPFLFDGYFDDPEATAAALDAGWFRTGDLGTLDEEGYLSIVGRRKEIIRTGGESVAPTEVEAILAEHEDIAEVAVLGIPDPEWGEVVCAAVVPISEQGPTLESLQQHCADRLASFKKPRRLERFDALPRTTATGQVQRALLVERILGRTP